MIPKISQIRKPAECIQLMELRQRLTLVRGGREPKVLVEVVNMKIVCERRTDEGLRTFKDNVVGTIRTIDSGVISE